MSSDPAPHEFAKAQRRGPSAGQARFRQIAQSLREAIAGGVYRAGDHLPTEMELAREHQVSRVTAAAALTELARAGLVTRTPRRGTIVQGGLPYPGSTPRPLVAWVVMRVESTFGLSLLRGIQLGARDAGFGLLLADSGATMEDEMQAIRDAVTSGAKGIMIFIRDGEHYNAEVLRLVLGGYPVVLVDRYLRGVPCASVSSDNVEGSRMLVNELLDAGHRHICVLTFPPSDTSTIQDRIHGYVQALTEAGIPVDYSLHYVLSTLDDVNNPPWDLQPRVVEDFVDFLQAHADVTAVYATNAFLGLVAWRAIQRLGLRIPDDMSLICVDPLETIPLSVPEVTCGVQQGEAIGRTAVALLQDVMAGKSPRTVQLQMHLRRAGSVGMPGRAAPQLTGASVPAQVELA